MKNTSKFGYTIYILIIIGLLLSFIVFVLEKQQIINLYQKPINQTEATPRPINDVSYAPATEEEQQSAEQTKQDILEQVDNPVAPPTGVLEVSLSAANQDSPGGPLVVRAIINGATSGECSLTLTQGNIIKEYAASIASKGTYYGCEGFDVPVEDLSVGAWQLTLEASNDNAKGVAEQEVNITI